MPKPRHQAVNQHVGLFFFPGDVDTVDETILEKFPEHAALISYIIAEWTQIEHRLALWFALRIQTEQAVMLRIVYALETSRARLNVMQAGLLETVPSDTRGHTLLTKLLDTVTGLLKLRNKYAHALYGVDTVSHELAIGTVGGKKKKPINLPVHELKDHLRRMKETSHQLAVILAAELQLPLGGPDKPGTVPAHPLGLRSVRSRQAPQAPPQSSQE